MPGSQDCAIPVGGATEGRGLVPRLDVRSDGRFWGLTRHYSPENRVGSSNRKFMFQFKKGVLEISKDGNWKSLEVKSIDFDHNKSSRGPWPENRFEPILTFGDAFEVICPEAVYEGQDDFAGFIERLTPDFSL
jgi:hypothetical protein